MKKTYPRWQNEAIAKALKVRRVVILSGPRQCGKTTLAQQIQSDEDLYLTLDDDLLLRAALTDPLGFLKHTSGTMIIDEVQKAPLLISAIKMVVDKDKTPGQFLLTGSTDIQKNPQVTESLAGRVKNIRLRTLSTGERLEKQPSFLENCFEKNWPAQIKGFDKPTVIGLAFSGGYPDAFDLTPGERRDWHLDYVGGLLTRDLKDIINIRRKDNLRQLLSILSAWSSKFMDASAIASNLATTRTTLASYINALESLYLFDRLEAWPKNDYGRATRREKIFATDTGLMTSLLDWDLKEVLYDPDRSGKIVETLVFNEISAQVDLNNECKIYHYRDRDKREIDFIIEKLQKEIIGVEVKAGSMVSSDDCRHLVWFQNTYAKNRPFIGIVLYTGENTLSLGQNIYAVPIAALWN
jgi:predicted AAA+ superfamily ATPase